MNTGVTVTTNVRSIYKQLCADIWDQSYSIQNEGTRFCLRGRLSTLPYATCVRIFTAKHNVIWERWFIWRYFCALDLGCRYANVGFKMNNSEFFSQAYTEAVKVVTLLSATIYIKETVWNCLRFLFRYSSKSLTVSSTKICGRVFCAHTYMLYLTLGREQRRVISA